LGEKQPFRIYKRLRIASSSLVVGWNDDASGLGTRVTDYLVKKLGAKDFAEIEPDGFFPMAGVSVSHDVVQFPECRFFYSRKHNLVICKSTPPRTDWFRFMDLVLEVAERYCHIREVYTFGAMVSLGAHTAPRTMLGVASSPEMRRELGAYDLAMDIDFETPPGQRPTLNSFFLWVARRRGIAAASLWVPIPFYLLTTEDPRAWKRVLEFLDRRFVLGLDLSDVDREVEVQDMRISQMASRSPLLSHYIQRLESNLQLTQEENEKLVKEIEEFLRKNE